MCARFYAYVGVILALGWRLTILPANDNPAYQLTSYVMTGLIIGAGGVGWFEVFKQFIPWLRKGQQEPVGPVRIRSY